MSCAAQGGRLLPALLLRAAALSAAAVCAAPCVAAAPSAQSYAASVTEAAQRFGIPETWIWRVMHAESRGRPRAVSHAGAMGLMQIMPATWRMLSAKHRLGGDPFETRANILAGAAYLRAMWDRYGDVRLMLAAYNAGPGRADAYAAGRRGLPAETLAYVVKIAPELGAEPLASNMSVVSPPVAGWREAGLFSVRSTTPTHSADAPDVPPSNGPRVQLFVPLGESPR
jgi:soluble lytic murein transglycosylase-like protein